MHLDLWRVVHSKHAVPIEVALFGNGILDSDFTRQNLSEREIDSAFGHRANAIRIHRGCAVNRAHNAVYVNGPVFVYPAFQLPEARARQALGLNPQSPFLLFECSGSFVITDPQELASIVMK